MHIYVLGPKVLQWNFVKIFCYLYKVVHKNIFANFWSFSIFNRNSGATWQQKWILSSASERAIHSEKRGKQPKSTLNCDTMPVQSISLEWTAHQTWSVTEKQTENIQTPYFLPTAGVRCSISPKLLPGGRGSQHHSKGWQSFFNPTHSFSYRVHRKFRGKWATHGFSAITP